MTTKTKKIDKVFLDASTLFSVGQIKTGFSQLWRLAENGRCQLLASRYVIEKAMHNLRYFNDLKILEGRLPSIRVVPEADVRLRCPIELPKRDSAVIMAAISARSDYFLTGDREYFGQYLGQTIMGMKVITVRDYLLRMLSSKGADLTWED